MIVTTIVIILVGFVLGGVSLIISGSYFYPTAKPTPTLYKYIYLIPTILTGGLIVWYTVLIYLTDRAIKNAGVLAPEDLSKEGYSTALGVFVVYLLIVYLVYKPKDFSLLGLSRRARQSRQNGGACPLPKPKQVNKGKQD